MRAPVPFETGLRVVVGASCSADSTSLGLSYPSAIAQTRERNCQVSCLGKKAGWDPATRILEVVLFAIF
jgi:hypothetical protein